MNDGSVFYARIGDALIVAIYGAQVNGNTTIAELPFKTVRYAAAAAMFTSGYYGYIEVTIDGKVGYTGTATGNVWGILFAQVAR